MTAPLIMFCIVALAWLMYNRGYSEGLKDGFKLGSKEKGNAQVPEPKPASRNRKSGGAHCKGCDDSGCERFKNLLNFRKG